jgi:hypothetical protein
MRHTGTSSRRDAPGICIVVFLLMALAPLARANAPAVEADYETPMVLQAADLLPDYLLAGEEFTVGPEVRSDGETNHYTILSPLGDTEAAGRDELEQAIQELRALALLQDTPKRTGAVVGANQGMKRVLTAPYRKVKRVVFHPLYAIEAVPGEIADYAGRVAAVGDLFKYGPRVYLRRSLGIDGARTFLARRLLVDAKTDNAALQDELRRVGWGVWLGGLVPELGDVYIDLGVDLSTEVGDWGDGNLGRAVAEVRREVFPRTGRRLLRAADVPVDLREAFRDHPHFTGPACVYRLGAYPRRCAGSREGGAPGAGNGASRPGPRGHHTADAP